MISNRDIHDNMCIALSNKHLSESMLIKLCETQLCHESFYELATLCYTDPNISCASFIDSINRFLDGNFCEDYTYLLQEPDKLNASEASKELALKQMIFLHDATYIYIYLLKLKFFNITFKNSVTLEIKSLQIDSEAGWQGERTRLEPDGV